ncbi:hypothetical protein [Lysinibacillus sp. NPDC047702]|uniref:CdiA C-terminal domain-containing protein n=1 Tax=unclassified Lysinibacillus TaxID=2636778 RepID=UPI003CFF2940
MLHSTKLLNKVLMVLVALLLLFNINYGAFKTSEAHANALTATFEEWAAASYATAVVATTTVAASAMHTEQYLKDNIDEMYQTAKETWPKMSADMKSNFLSSLDQMADGVITAGDWLTAGLDTLKAKFATDAPSIPAESNGNYLILPNGYNVTVTDTNGKVWSLGNYIRIDIGASLAKTNAGEIISIDLLSNPKLSIPTVCESYPSCSSIPAATTAYNALRSYTANPTLSSFGDLVSAFGASMVLTLDGNVINPSDSTYNRMDQWLRDAAIPAGNLGVYVPTDAIGWTPDGYRLGLSEDGQQLLKLPDGTPWEGDYSWRQPLLDIIDGVPAILDSAIGSWVDLNTGKKIRDATIPEMASATGVDESTAEYVLIRAKDEEKAREGEDTKAGKFIGNLNELTPDERKVVNELVAEGKIVEQIPRSTIPGEKTPDFKIDGVLTELKTLKNPNVNTGVGRIKDAFKQNAEEVIIDARESGLTKAQAQEILNRAKGTYPDKQLPGKVEIWIKEKVTN